MKEEDKKLLLKDLSARLPYGVIVRHAVPLIDNYGNETGEFWYKRGYLCNINTLDDITTTIIENEGDDEGYEHICVLESTVPYLRTISSMTKEEYNKYCELEWKGIPLYDWLNENHFDYRGLIGKDLAIEVTEENNPYK